MPNDDFYKKMFQKAEYHSRKVTRDYQFLDLEDLKHRHDLWLISLRVSLIDYFRHFENGKKWQA